MKLNLLDFENISSGAVRVEEREEGFSFYRFTKAQKEMYKERSADFYRKTFSTSGITLRFETDSTSLFLDVNVEKSSSRTYFAFDLEINGKIIDSLQNFDGTALPQDYTTIPAPLGSFSKTFELGEGKKEICIYFPWSVAVVLKELTLNGTYIKAVKRTKKLLAIGDSITHGYDALHPTNKYITKIAKHLDAEEYNKAIGGEVFVPELARLREDFVPDFITVAYGTNDWSLKDKDTFLKNATEFYNSLSISYPTSRIFAITPIWRRDYENPEKAFPFAEVEKAIESICKSLDNVTVIHGFDLVPKDAKYFADLRLHPNDKGFEYYAEGIIKALEL